MADQTRIRILHLFYTNKELTISDIELALEFTQTKTARHITYLKNAGIVSSRKHHQWVFYYIKDEAMDLVAQLLQLFKNDPVLKNDQQVIETLNSNRELSANKLDRKRWSS